MAVPHGRPLDGGPLGHGGRLTTPRNGTRDACREEKRCG
eukprot:COSAG03_NODE_1029_length_4991_cov_62.803557_4_plen_39_part_00